jgi:hypothetical protein
MWMENVIESCSCCFFTTAYQYMCVSEYNIPPWSGVRLSPLGTPATIWHIVPAPDDGWWLWVCSSRWNDWQGKPKYSKNICPSAALSSTNLTWLDLGSNPGRHGGKPATNCLSNDTNKYNTIFFSYLIHPLAALGILRCRIFLQKSTIICFHSVHMFKTDHPILSQPNSVHNHVSCSSKIYRFTPIYAKVLKPMYFSLALQPKFYRPMHPSSRGVKLTTHLQVVLSS